MKVTVYKGKYGYSTMAKNKDAKCYLPVKFKRGAEPNKDVNYLVILDGFFSAYKDRNGEAHPQLVIMAWKEDENYQYVDNNLDETLNHYFDKMLNKKEEPKPDPELFDNLPF